MKDIADYELGPGATVPRDRASAAIAMAARRVVTWPELFGRGAAHVAGGRAPFDFVVVDEAQDVGVAELRFLAALGAGRPDSLFFVVQECRETRRNAAQSYPQQWHCRGHRFDPG